MQNFSVLDGKLCNAKQDFSRILKRAEDSLCGKQ